MENIESVTNLVNALNPQTCNFLLTVFKIRQKMPGAAQLFHLIHVSNANLV